MGQRDGWYQALGYTICDVQFHRKALVAHETEAIPLATQKSSPQQLEGGRLVDVATSWTTVMRSFIPCSAFNDQLSLKPPTVSDSR